MTGCRGREVKTEGLDAMGENVEMKAMILMIGEGEQKSCRQEQRC
jgi:hypothetical protein